MKKKRKSILIIGPFPKPTTGVSLANLVVKGILEESEHFTPDILNTAYNKFDENIGSFSLHKLFFYLSFNFKIYKVVTNNSIYFTPGQTFFGVAKYTAFIIFAWLLGKELIIHVHGNHLGTEYASLTGWKKKLFYFLISKMTKGIVLSESLRPNLKPFIAEKNIHVLYNFAEDYLSNANTPMSTDGVRIIYLSNLMKEKGILVLLESLRMLEENGVSYEAKIAGNIDANHEEEIKSQLASLKNTSYVGVVNGEEKKAFLDWGNTFVLPTFYQMEGQPISLIEAMATGNVLVTTRHAGIPDIVNEGKNGYFVEKKNAQDLYNRLEFLKNNSKKIAEIAAYNKIQFEKNYTRKQFKESLLHILKNT